MAPFARQIDLSTRPGRLGVQSKGTVRQLIRPQLQNHAALRLTFSTAQFVPRGQCSVSRRLCITKAAAAAVDATDDGAFST